MKLFQSFGYAWQGLKHCFSTQLNFRIHLLVLALVSITGFVLRITKSEWCFIIICSMLVLALELLNTAIEHLSNVITTEFHPTIKIIKDVAAGAVLICAAGSVITGMVIFFPKIVHLLKG